MQAKLFAVSVQIISHGTLVVLLDDLNDHRAVRLSGFFDYFMEGPVSFKTFLVAFHLCFNLFCGIGRLSVFLKHKMDGLTYTG